MRVRAARRQLDGALGDVATALVAGELRLRCHRAVVGPRQVGPGQEDQRLQGRRPRDLALEKVTGVIEPGEVLVKVGEDRPRLGGRTGQRGGAGRSRQQDGERARTHDAEHDSHRCEL